MSSYQLVQNRCWLLVIPGVYIVLRFLIYFPPFPLIFFPKINGKGGENLESLKKYLPHWLHLKDFSPSVGSHIYLWNRNISFFSNSVQRSWLYPLLLTLQIRVARSIFKTVTFKLTNFNMTECNILCIFHSFESNFI